jgi:hypothetical protein
LPHKIFSGCTPQWRAMAAQSAASVKSEYSRSPGTAPVTAAATPGAGG